MKLSLLFCCLLGFFVNNVNGQQQGDPPPMSFSAEQLSAATQMLQAQRMDVQLQATFDKMIEQVSGKMPADKKQAFAVAMKKFIAKYASWDALKYNMASIYAAKFSLAELKQITAFYETPAGKKLCEKLPELTAEGMQLGQRVVAERQTELQQMMVEAMSKP